MISFKTLSVNIQEPSQVAALWIAPPSSLPRWSLCSYFLSALQEDREEMDDERKHKHIAEGVAAAAVGYGLYEHHQKSEAEDKLEELGYDSDGNKKKDHHLFS